MKILLCNSRQWLLMGANIVKYLHRTNKTHKRLRRY